MSPCQQSMDYYFESPENAKKFRGRKRITLPVSIDNDIKNANEIHNDLPIKQFQTKSDLYRLRNLASDRVEWKNLSFIICNIAQGEQ